jgi:energy-coupling factor transporter ATP-binding protein EcfA2
MFQRSDNMVEYVIETSGLTKRFGAVTAVDDVSFKIGKGDFWGLLGLNGAGKSTLLNILTGQKKPDNGTARVMGVSPVDDPVGVKKKIGIVPPGGYVRDPVAGDPRGLRANADDVIHIVQEDRKEVGGRVLPGVNPTSCTPGPANRQPAPFPGSCVSPLSLQVRPRRTVSW